MKRIISEQDKMKRIISEQDKMKRIISEQDKMKQEANQVMQDQTSLDLQQGVDPLLLQHVRMFELKHTIRRRIPQSLVGLSVPKVELIAIRHTHPCWCSFDLHSHT
jgi:hypothetical protein